MCIAPPPLPLCNVDGKLRPQFFFATIHDPNIVMGAGGGGNWLDEGARKVESSSYQRGKAISVPLPTSILTNSAAYEVQTRLRVNVRSEESLT